MSGKIVPQSTLHRPPLAIPRHSVSLLPSLMAGRIINITCTTVSPDRNDNSRCIVAAIVALLRHNYVRWCVPAMLLSRGRHYPSDYRRRIGAEAYSRRAITSTRKKRSIPATPRKRDLPGRPRDKWLKFHGALFGEVKRLRDDYT